MKYLGKNGLRVEDDGVWHEGNFDPDNKVDNSRVLTDVPPNAKFTDTIYTHPASHPASMITESTTKRFVSETEKSKWNNKAEISDIPTKVSELTNDSNYVTQDGLGDAGLGDMIKAVYDTNNNGIVDNAEKVSGFTVGTNVPANAKFTDTIYTLPTATSTRLGGIKIGNNLEVEPDGTLNAQGSGAVVKQEVFVVEPNQTTFNLELGHYQPNTNTISFYIYGGKQPNILFTELSSTSFAINSQIDVGSILIVEYLEVLDSNFSIPNAHANEHLQSGVDPIPIATNLQEGLMSKDDKVKLNKFTEVDGKPYYGGKEIGGATEIYYSDIENALGYIPANEEDLVEVVDNLTTQDATKALSAKQGAELFQSVSDGKTLVAGAITDKGVSTGPGDTFATMADNIGSIETGVDTSDATALAGDILTGKTAYVKGSKVTGNIVTRTGNVTGQSVSRSGTTVRIRPQAGYYLGGASDSVQISDTNFIAANIVSGKSIFGLAGTASTGTRSASGTVTPSSTAAFNLNDSTTVSLYSAIVTGLTFRPSIIVLQYSTYDFTVFSSKRSSSARTIIADRSSRVSAGYVDSYTISLTSPAAVSTRGFTLPVRRSSAYNWYAYE